MSTKLKQTETIHAAEENLKRLLDWIGRYDMRSAFITGIVVGMLGYLASAVPELSAWNLALYVFVIASLSLLGTSLIAIYCGQFPRTNSPNASLLFFGTIAAPKQDEFDGKFSAMTDEQYLADLTRQCHVNASIVNTKFRSLKVALWLLIAAVFPWLAAIYLIRVID